MAVRDGGSRLPVVNVEKGGVVDSPSTTVANSVPIPDEMHADNSGDRYKGPFDDVV